MGREEGGGGCVRFFLFFIFFFGRREGGEKQKEKKVGNWKIMLFFEYQSNISLFPSPSPHLSLKPQIYLFPEFFSRLDLRNLFFPSPFISVTTYQIFFPIRGFETPPYVFFPFSFLFSFPFFFFL